MSDRERWTIYPLLFLALGLAMRAVLVPPSPPGDLEAVRIVCREIVVQDEAGAVMLHLGRVAGGGGRLEVNDGDGNPLMALGTLPPDADAADGRPGAGVAGPRGVVEFAGPDGEVVRRLTPTGD